MRLIIIATLFLIPLFGFASFPIQISIPSDTTIETKKETMEEYKIRIQKQLYHPFVQTEKPMNLQQKKEFEKEKQRKRQEFFANRNKKRKKSRY